MRTAEVTLTTYFKSQAHVLFLKEKLYLQIWQPVDNTQRIIYNGLFTKANPKEEWMIFLGYNDYVNLGTY